VIKIKYRIPILKTNIPPSKILIPKIKSVLYSGVINEGKHVYRFEDLFKKKFNYNNVLAVSSGTAALHIAFILSEIKKGDEVITSPITAEPTNVAILQSGGKPVFADVDSSTGNICPKSIIKLINKKTKAICVVHYAGYPADILKIKSIAKKNNLILIEDCAHAIGAKVNNKFVGSFGDFSIFSFQAAKHITTIDGGILVIKNKNYLQKAKQIRWFGLKKNISREKNRIKYLGYKYNMTNISAIIGIQQLRYFNKVIKLNISNGIFFDKNISKIKNLEIIKKSNTSKPSYWLYTILTAKSKKLILSLNKNKIEASKVHLPNYLHPIFNFKKKLPGAIKFYSKLVHIPCGYWVKNTERKRILDVLKEFK
jgi:dTDP-4-amino-4,6-dideoxygalactose transaminase